VKSRRLILVALLAVGAMLANVTPANAGLVVTKIHLFCKATVGAPLTYPVISGGATTSWSVACGKAKPNPHDITGGIGLKSYCAADVVAPNGKKPLIHKGSGLPGSLSNCTLNAGGVVTGLVLPGAHCGLSTGVGGSGTLTINGKGSPIALSDVNWLGVGGNLIVTATGTKDGGSSLVVIPVVAFPDTLQKNASCIGGATQFKIVGTGVAVGCKKGVLPGCLLKLTP